MATPHRCPQARAINARLLAALLCLAGLLALAACGSARSHSAATTPSSASAGRSTVPRAVRKATLILDFVPNAVHAGIYRALAAGYYRSEGIDLRVVQPSSTSDTLNLIAAGRAQFGLADGIDMAQLVAHHRDAQAVMAIAQRPLGGVIALASEHLSSPAQLQGRTVGITGVPSDTAVLDTIVADAGGDPAKVHVVTVGFNGAQALLAGKVAAFVGFWPDDGVALQVHGHPITVFKLDSYGGPAYPGLVAFTTRSLIASDPTLVRGFVAATVRGYQDTLRDPAQSLADLLAGSPEVEAPLARASLQAYLPLFAEEGRVAFGTLQPQRIAALSTWLLANGLTHAPLTPAAYGTNALLSNPP